MKVLLLSLALAAPITGCVHSPSTPSVPIVGAANQFDSDTYQALATAHAFVTTAASNPAVLTASQKSILNQMIQDLNAADLLYAAYHSAAVAGTATTATQASMQTALNKVSADQSSYAAASGVK